jgi:hypothetical protein
MTEQARAAAINMLNYHFKRVRLQQEKNTEGAVLIMRTKWGNEPEASAAGASFARLIMFCANIWRWFMYSLTRKPQTSQTTFVISSVQFRLSPKRRRQHSLRTTQPASLCLPRS